MDQALSQLFSLPFVFLCIAIAGVTEVLRRIGEYFLDKPSVPMEKTSKFWQGLMLPLAPVANGVIFGFFVKTYPYPETWHEGGARVVFGLVAGLMSGLVYRVAKAMLDDKLKMFQKNTPPPTPPEPPAAGPDVSFRQ